MRVLYTWQPEANKANTLKAAQAVLAQGELADLAIEDMRRWKLSDLTEEVLALDGKKGYTAPITERAITIWTRDAADEEAAVADAPITERAITIWTRVTVGVVDPVSSICMTA